MTKKKKIKLVDINETRMKILKDPEVAIGYLNDALEYEGPKKEMLFLKSLRHVVEAHGMTEISRQSSISRRALYKALSKTGNPTWHTIMAIMTALNCHFKVI